MLKVNFTRMELMRLRARLNLARRGHKLLKDKQEQLLAYFYRLVEESRGLRDRLEKDFLVAVDDFLAARAPYGEAEMSRLLAPPVYEPEISFERVSLLNISTIRSTCRWREPAPARRLPDYPLDLRAALTGYRDVFEALLRLAELETMILLFAREIEQTRRRVNSLEHVLIPELEETTRAIEVRLEEVERENFARLRHIKNLAR